MAVAIAAPAAADAIHVLYANTLALTDAHGEVTAVLLKKGGKLEQINARGAGPPGSGSSWTTASA